MSAVVPPAMNHRDVLEKNLVFGASGPFEVIIGMEIHAQVASRSKLFSGARTAFGGEPNAQVSLVDAAMPGMLPVLNRWCVAQAVRTGLGLGARINKRSVFDRKNYFYPDLPAGYQISQFREPIVGRGEVLVTLRESESVRIGIERLHLEQDAGKSLHDLYADSSAVDLNRAGVALMEIVTQPDLRSAEEARAFVTKLRTILRYLGTCDGDMEKGNLRADVNVSVRKPDGPLGTRCEIKNVNSIRFVGQAIASEATRQIALLEAGGCVAQQTRLFDPVKGETRAMRSKEESHDYRYFPDPDLKPLHLDESFISSIKATLPELPDGKRKRFVSAYGLSPYDADILCAEREAADFFEAAAQGRNAKRVANWIIGDVFGRLNQDGLTIDRAPVQPEQIGTLVDLIDKQTISGKIAKEVLQIMWTEGGDPAEIVEARGLAQIVDEALIEETIRQIAAANPDKVAQLRDKPKLAGWFIGQVMKAMQGKANPQVVNACVETILLKPDA